MKVVILGYGPMLTNLIAGCRDASCDIVGVFRYDKVRYPLVDRYLIDLFNPSREYNYIKSHNLYEINARSANSAEFKKEVMRLGADIVLVGTWGEKLKKSIIQLPKIATINVHPALLPKYRGPNPYLQAIKNLENKSGVTFHLMDEDFDTGPILIQKEVAINPTDTGLELRERIVSASRDAVRDLMIEMDREVIIPVSQDEKKASYFSHILEEEVMLDFTKSAEEISAKIRGFHPWYKCYYAHNSHFFCPNPYKIEILEKEMPETTLFPGAIVEKSACERSITFACGDNKLIKMSEMTLFGGINRFFTTLYIKNRVRVFRKS